MCAFDDVKSAVCFGCDGCTLQEKLAQQHVFDPSARGQGNIPRKVGLQLAPQQPLCGRMRCKDSTAHSNEQLWLSRQCVPPHCVVKLSEQPINEPAT